MMTSAVALNNIWPDSEEQTDTNYGVREIEIPVRYPALAEAFKKEALNPPDTLFENGKPHRQVSWIGKIFSSLTGALTNLFHDRTAENVLTYEHARDRAQTDFSQLLKKDHETKENGILRQYVRKARNAMNVLTDDKDIQSLCRETYETQVPQIFEILKMHEQGNPAKAFAMVDNLKKLSEETRIRQSDLVIKAGRLKQAWAVEYIKILQEANKTANLRPAFLRLAPAPAAALGETIPKHVQHIIQTYEKGYKTPAYHLVDALSGADRSEREIAKEIELVIQNIKKGTPWAKTFAKIAREANTTYFERQNNSDGVPVLYDVVMG
ncbi:MAG: hypothetical protein H6861_01135 [Rhodospirillales bacterium]|nr:hypothetical protein [Rhodospirillales bacterium]